MRLRVTPIKTSDNGSTHWYGRYFIDTNRSVYYQVVLYTYYSFWNGSFSLHYIGHYSNHYCL